MWRLSRPIFTFAHDEAMKDFEDVPATASARTAHWHDVPLDLSSEGTCLTICVCSRALGAREGVRRVPSTEWRAPLRV
eukprot:5068477-Alexandrium_andersonii.AAC.1